MKISPTVSFSHFPEIVFNSSVSFDNGGSIALEWHLEAGVFTAQANGVWLLEVIRRSSAVDVKISAWLDKVYDRVEFKYFHLDPMAAEHILPQSCFKGGKSRELRKVESPEVLEGETLISITNKSTEKVLNFAVKLLPPNRGKPVLPLIFSAANCLLSLSRSSTRGSACLRSTGTTAALRVSLLSLPGAAYQVT